jgi:hypothetical protein
VPRYKDAFAASAFRHALKRDGARSTRWINEPKESERTAAARRDAGSPYHRCLTFPSGTTGHGRMAEIVRIFFGQSAPRCNGETPRSRIMCNLIERTDTRKGPVCITASMRSVRSEKSKEVQRMTAARVHGNHSPNKPLQVRTRFSSSAHQSQRGGSAAN